MVSKQFDAVSALARQVPMLQWKPMAPGLQAAVVMANEDEPLITDRATASASSTPGDVAGPLWPAL